MVFVSDWSEVSVCSRRAVFVSGWSVVFVSGWSEVFVSGWSEVFVCSRVRFSVCHHRRRCRQPQQLPAAARAAPLLIK
ncbi:hypothetical protein [Methanimicrococcus hongohii]|uniref:hypothetical protein n=1 Tax=Methanimicrococcus hongohii TaxID=3028295 RepID=UPI002930E881|nr:hypothetical protein [Methanimicrococcus sp. Hf6]